MAFLYVREYQGPAVDHVRGRRSGVTAATPTPPQEPGYADQKIAVGASPVSSQPFGPFTRLIRVNTDTHCAFAIGPPGTVATAGGRIPANLTETYGVEPGHVISVMAA